MPVEAEERSMKYVLALMIALVLNASANLLMKAGMKTVQDAGGFCATAWLGVSEPC